MFCFSQLEALEFKKLETKSGIKFWFVEDKSIPIVSVSFSFKGGAFFDEKGKEGTSNFVASLLDEGSENFNAKQFQEKMKSLGMKLRFSVNRDSFSGTFQTIEENKKESFNLLRLALTKPTFSNDSIEKIRNQVSASIRINQSDIQRLSSEKFDENFYKDHNFSRSEIGTLESITKIKRDDLMNYLRNFLTKSNLTIGISGDVEKDELTTLIHSTFKDLAKGVNMEFNIPELRSLNKGVLNIKKKTPQTSVVFGHRGLQRNHEDFFAARIANYVLGGGGFQSKLYKKIREEKGLVYSIYSYLIPYINDGVIIGGFSTKNETVAETIDLLKSEWKKAKNIGISESELQNAKSYFIGSFSRNFSSTLSIASLLKTIQVYNLGIEYFTERKKIIENLSLNKVNEVSKRFFEVDDLFIIVVGNAK